MTTTVLTKPSLAIYHALLFACVLNPHVCMGAWEVGINSRSYECEAVAAEPFDRNHPNEQHMSVTLAVSAMNRGVKAAAVDHLLIEISAEQARWKAVELSPGAIIVDAGGNMKIVDAGGNIKINKPLPRQVKVTSGILENGNKAWWKIFPADQNTLEGTYELSLLFRVPKCWRGDVADLKLTVKNIGDKAVGNHLQRIGLYVRGDGEAKTILGDYLSCHDKKEELKRKMRQSNISNNRSNELLHMHKKQIERCRKTLGKLKELPCN